MTRATYTALLRLLLPLAVGRLYWRSLRAPAYRQRVAERLMRDPDGPPAADVWLHAVSVGEVQAAQPVIRHLLERDPPMRVLVTTTTPTGAERLESLFHGRVAHRYTPFDLPGIMTRFLDAVRPRLAVVMETEIWPNTLAEAGRRGIPAVLANARLSERSARGYARVQPLTREALGHFAIIAAQAQADAGRFMALGAPASRVEVTGSIKFDQGLPASLHEQAEAARRAWGADRSVWVAASTHEGEDEPVLAAHRAVRAAIPNALLVLVPRHPERFERVAELATRAGFGVVRRSSRQPCGPETGVYVGDTMGELQVLLAAGDAAFIGGSLVPVGGHNLLEAAAVGVPAATGPQFFNFAAIVELLVAENAAVVVQDGTELGRLMVRWLGDAAERARLGENGRRVVEENRGALDRLLAVIERYLG